MRRSYAGGSVRTTLVSPITTSSPSAVLTSSLGWPDTATGPCAAVIDRGGVDEEKVLISDRSGANITFAVRGYDGTSPRNHNAGATIEHVATAIDHDEANAHIDNVTGVHGLSAGDRPVGRTATETLTNKTISGPAADFVTVKKAGLEVATKDGVETLTNKAIDSPNLTGSAQAATLHANVLTAGGKIVATIDGAETLVNKALTNPTLNNPTVNGGNIDAADITNSVVTGSAVSGGSVDVPVLKKGGLDAATLAGIETLQNKVAELVTDVTKPLLIKTAGSEVASVERDGSASFVTRSIRPYYAGPMAWNWPPSTWIRAFGYTAGEWALDGNHTPGGYLTADSGNGIRVDKAGMYRVMGCIFFVTIQPTTTRLSVQLGFGGANSRNGPVVYYAVETGQHYAALPVFLTRLAVGDYVSCWAMHDSSPAGEMQPGINNTYMIVEYVGR